MKEIVGTIFKAGATKIIITFGLGIGVAFYVSNNIVKKQLENQALVAEIKKEQIKTTDIIQNKVIPFLESIHKSADSANINAKKALEIGRINVRCNIEMSKQLKGFDILKFYDPFMMWNKADTVLKKKSPSNLMYVKTLENKYLN